MFYCYTPIQRYKFKTMFMLNQALFLINEINIRNPIKVKVEN